MDLEFIKKRNWKKWITIGVAILMGFVVIHEVIVISTFHSIFGEMNHFISQQETEQRNFEKEAHHQIKTVESGMNKVLDGYNQGVDELNQKRDQFFKEFNEGASRVDKSMDEGWLKMRRSMLVSDQIIMYSDDDSFDANSEKWKSYNAKKRAELQAKIDEIDQVIAEYEKYSPTDPQEKELRHNLFILQADLLANYNDDQYHIRHTPNEKKEFLAKKDAIKKEIIATREKLKPYEKTSNG